MSAYIGEIKGGGRDLVDVWASRAGAELHTFCGFDVNPRNCVTTLQPIEARNLAALLVRAAEETERMRTHPTT